MTSRQQAIAAEISEVERLLRDLPDEQIILRNGLRARLQQLRLDLASYHSSGLRRAEVELTFRGRPVHRSEGVEGDFAGKVLEQYNKAVALLSANQHKPLRHSGPIPGHRAPKLFVCDRALGSFGFLLRELEQVEGEEVNKIEFIEKDLGTSPTFRAVEQMEMILAASQSSDDELAEAAADTDRRTLHAIRDFLTVVADNEATTQHKTPGRTPIYFPDVASVRSAAERLSDDNIEESTVIVVGRVDGVLPGRRWFELLSEGEEGRITGKVDLSLSDDRVNDLKQAIDVRVKATLHLTTVGHSQTAKRYRLLDWVPTEGGQQTRLNLQ